MSNPDSATPARGPDESFRPLPASEAELGWTRQPMVRWFDPSQLAATGVRAVLSSIFGAYADKREVQAALTRENPPRIHEYDGEREIWIDYVSDLGDGFDSTYTLAWLLGQQTLPAVDGEGAAQLAATQRGRVLVLGGDQVYPTASRTEYENRFSGPYSAAFPWHDDEGTRPRLFAVPGNHDWYDGLTAYLRQFCQERWIGGWQTRQARSYFALKLPKRWWLLGVDMQLESDMDRPQLEYFQKVAREIQEGDQVILCTPEPAWVHQHEDPRLYSNLAFFERTVLCPRKAKLVLTLTGDLHHYARYSDSTGERHKITAGGGGAYLYGTHLLPERVELPKAEATEPGSGRTAHTKTYERKQVYPAVGTSRALRGGSWRLPFLNPSFALFMGVVYTLFAWFVQATSRTLPGAAQEGVLGHLHHFGLAAGLSQLGGVVIHSPFLVAFAALIVAGMVGFATPDPGVAKWRKYLVGGVHGALHLLLLGALMVGLAHLGQHALPFQLGGGLWQTVGFTVLFTAGMVGVGGVAAGLLMGLALLPGVNFNEAFSSQHIEDYKNFVRLHIDESGVLRVYPVGVDRAKRWRFRRPTSRAQAYYEPADGQPPRVRLIDGPLTIAAPRRVFSHAITIAEQD